MSSLGRPREHTSQLYTRADSFDAAYALSKEYQCPKDADVVCSQNMLATWLKVASGFVLLAEKTCTSSAV